MLVRTSHGHQIAEAPFMKGEAELLRFDLAGAVGYDAGSSILGWSAVEEGK